MKPHRNTTHLQARELIHLDMDNSLDEDERLQLDRHLEGCVECRAYAEQIAQLDTEMRHSLQERWPESHPKEVELAAKLADILPRVRKNQMKIKHGNTLRSLGWGALAILLIAGLVWTIKTLAPLPSQSPAGQGSVEITQVEVDVTQVVVLPIYNTPSVELTPQAPIPTTTTANPIPSGPVSLFPGVEFSFASELPTAPETMTLYRQQLSEAVTAETARQVATEWGVAGGVYSSPSEGMNDVIFDVMDGARTMRFLNFPDQFIYGVGYVSPSYGSALMDNGPLPSFDEMVSIATKFLQPLGILDLPYRTQPLETERGVVAFTPLIDGYPVVQEIGVDRSNIGWIDVKVNAPGQVTQVEYSDHDFQPVDSYPILTAQQAWDRFTNDSTLQHSRYAVLTPEGVNTYQSWVPKYAPGQQADIYGWVNTYSAADPDSPALVMINNLPMIGETAGMSPDNQYDVRYVHAWGQIQDSPTDGIALQVAGWEVSSLDEEYITGTVTTQAGVVQLVTLDHSLTLINPPTDIPDGTQAGIMGVVLDGNPATLNWKFIETGQIPFSYGASNTCGGGGGGGESQSDANFGAGSFAHINLDSQNEPAIPQVDQPYQPGDEINAVSGNVYVTQHVYLGGNTRLEVIFSPDPTSGLNMDWAYSLIGDALSGIEQYNHLPITISGKVDRVEDHIVYISVANYEPVYPGSAGASLDGDGANPHPGRQGSRAVYHLCRGELRAQIVCGLPTCGCQYHRASG